MSKPESQFNITRSQFGEIDGSPVDLYRLTNGEVHLEVITYGGIIRSLETKDKDGNYDDIVHGFDSLSGYLGGHPYFGAIIGRYGNRIANGAFEIDGNRYNLAQNNGPNALHGGITGFDKVIWSATELTESNAVGLQLSYTSVDGEEGYPGELLATVIYRLTDDNELSIDYHATTTRPTHCNLTNHSYFNLNGHDAGDILDHMLSIRADRYTPVDATLIPTGELASVSDTPFDFRAFTSIGERIDSDHEQIRFGGGYDHNYVLNGSVGQLRRVIIVQSEKSGRKMEVWTTEPGVQLYTGNFLDGSIQGKSGTTYGRRSAFCLETQHFPDSPNQTQFPSTLLLPNETYSSRTVYKFDVIEDSATN